MSNRFHLAIPVRSIEESKKFYCDFLGCDAGSFEDGKWQDINFWGNELTLHQAGEALHGHRQYKERLHLRLHVGHVSRQQYQQAQWQAGPHSLTI